MYALALKEIDMQKAIVKIDLCHSKTFAGEREKMDPLIRIDTLNQLAQVSEKCFPESTVAYPDGSFYKADGDAIFYILDMPSVALRGAIEFMQLWFHKNVPAFPDCRVFLDRSAIDKTEIASRVQLTGRAFENISVIEKGRHESRIYVTEDIIGALDTTMAKFSFIDTVSPRQGEILKLYYVDFDDPRIVHDSSLVHALFVAHPKATEARERLFELFLIEFIFDTGDLKSFKDFINWSQKKGYSIPPEDNLRKIMERSEYFEERNGRWCLVHNARIEVETAQLQFTEAKCKCIKQVEQALEETTKRADATAGLPIEKIVEEYLCGIFSEIRMMANYFRSTLQLFDSPIDQFACFDYIIKRQLDAPRLEYYTLWFRGFILGLRTATTEGNLYIAAIFHNVLATYYLNRSSETSGYQIELLKDRKIYLDTNALYSLLVEASPFHEEIVYFIERLSKLGIRANVMPISVWEYEEALIFVERNYDDRGPKEILIRQNPWLYQQFKSDESRYLYSISVCRQKYSITKDIEIGEENFNEIDNNLNGIGLQLDRDSKELSQEEADKMWNEHINWMTSNYWDINRYWDFINKEFPASVRRHDMTCLKNLVTKEASIKPDAMGPKVVFITLDSKIFRLRKMYSFICSPIQYLEFILPYLFLSDIPLKDAKDFPNKLLSAQLATLLVKRPPTMTEIVGAYFRNPSITKEDPKKVFYNVNEDMARALSNDRFIRLVSDSGTLTEKQREELAAKTSSILAEAALITGKSKEDYKRLKELEKNLMKKDSTIKRLQKTLAYWRAQSRRK